MKAMDWAGFSRLGRQTIDSVILYVVIEDIFSFSRILDLVESSENFIHPKSPIDEFDDYLLFLANPQFLSR